MDPKDPPVSVSTALIFITACAAVPTLYMSSWDQTQVLMLGKAGTLLTELLAKLLDSQLHRSGINFFTN